LRGEGKAAESAARKKKNISGLKSGRSEGRGTWTERETAENGERKKRDTLIIGKRVDWSRRVFLKEERACRDTKTGNRKRGSCRKIVARVEQDLMIIGVATRFWGAFGKFRGFSPGRKRTMSPGGGAEFGGTGGKLVFNSHVSIGRRRAQRKTPGKEAAKKT